MGTPFAYCLQINPDCLTISFRFWYNFFSNDYDYRLISFYLLQAMENSNLFNPLLDKLNYSCLRHTLLALSEFKESFPHSGLGQSVRNAISSDKEIKRMLKYILGPSHGGTAVLAPATAAAASDGMMRDFVCKLYFVYLLRCN
jgi:hypothetical protein